MEPSSGNCEASTDSEAIVKPVSLERSSIRRKDTVIKKEDL